MTRPCVLPVGTDRPPARLPGSASAAAPAPSESDSTVTASESDGAAGKPGDHRPAQRAGPILRLSRPFVPTNRHCQNLKGRSLRLQSDDAMMIIGSCACVPTFVGTRKHTHKLSASATPSQSSCVAASASAFQPSSSSFIWACRAWRAAAVGPDHWTANHLK